MEDQRILYICGTQGSGHESYLLSAGEEDGFDMGQVLDLGRKRLFPPIEVVNVLQQGYWESFNGDQRILPDLLRMVRPASR